MKKTLIFLSMSVFLLSACKKTDVDIEESGQQIGDMMASIDESGGNGGSIAFLDSGQKTIDRLAPANFLERFGNFVQPVAYATSCALGSSFTSCSSSSITRNFNDCTVGGATFSGSVVFTWAGPTASSCQISASGDSASRNPNFTVTGRRGATLTVSKTGTNGQQITYNGGSGSSRTFTFSNDGIRRVFASGSTTLFDFTTQTTDDITITGANRSNRVLSGGTLRITNNLTSTSCDVTPTAVTWSSTCNCAVSGSWTGTCSDGKESTVTITGCGTATITNGTETQDFTFDRCYGV